jgi:hemerythrin-like domain-containing protein
MRHARKTRQDTRRLDVFRNMRAEHKAVLGRLTTLLASARRIAARAGAAPTEEARVRAFTDHLEKQFATHMRAEDMVIYPVLETALTGARPSLAPLRGEHDTLRRMLEGLRETLAEPAGAVRNEQIAVQAQDLADLLRIHIRKEEAIVFAVADRLLAPRELSALGAQLAQLLSPATPSPGRAPRASRG